jgi:hypothetical protein
MRIFYILIIFFWFALCPAPAREPSGGDVAGKNTEKAGALLDKFSRRCERRTEKAVRRFDRYERKLMKSLPSNPANPRMPVVGDNPMPGNEPLIDSLRLVEGFRQYTGDSAGRLPSPLTGSVTRAQRQLDITRRTKDELMQRKEYWKNRVKTHPEYGKYLGKMEKERYYYTAQVNEYRKVLRNPSLADGKLTDAIRKDPRFGDYVTALPAKPQNPDRMQPRRLVRDMMQSSASDIDPDAARLIGDAGREANDVLDKLRSRSATFGCLDNAAQMPRFTPNPYKTKSFFERIDVGFNLRFDSRTRFLPASGVAGVQASFRFDTRFSIGALADYRFGTGEVKNIRLSHAGYGFGAFAGYRIWKGLGIQTGYERSRRAETETNEIRYPAAWYSSALAGLTWEYGIGKKLKGTVAVLFDALYRRHTPQTNALQWRMGWNL